MEERRLEGARLLLEGKHTSTHIAEVLGVAASTIRHWARTLKLLGQYALKATVGGGQPKRLHDQQEEELCALLDAGAVSNGFANEQWTSPRVREVIGCAFDEWYPVDHVYRVLHCLGYSVQKPDKWAVERDEEAIQTWAKTRLVDLGKKESGWAHDRLS